MEQNDQVLDIFDGLGKKEYVIRDGYKIPYSDFVRDDEYYFGVSESKSTTDMLKLKDRTTALFDMRWQSARDVIDLVAAEIGIDAAKSGLYLYAPRQEADGTLSSELALRIREWSSSQGDKMKLKKRVNELEQQVEILTKMLRGE